MDIRQAKTEIRQTVKAYLQKNDNGEYCIPEIHQRPLLLMGPPGIGKTQIMEQAAAECGIGLVAYTITHHTRQSAVGLPFIKEEQFEGRTYAVTEYTMSEIIASVYHAIEGGHREGILFIDEINCVSETLAPTMLQFLQCKRFGNQAVPQGWIIVAAGNPPEYNRAARDFDMVTLDRVRCLRVEADFPAWKEYAYKAQIHRAILSYLELRPQNFYRVETDVDGLRFVTARGWEDLSNLLSAYEALGFSVSEEVVREFLPHEEIAQDAAAYFELYGKYRDDYGIGEILAGNAAPAVYARLERAAFDERLSVVNLLLDGLTGYFKSVSGQRAVTDAWYGFLKEYRRRLSDTETGREAAEIYDTLLREREPDLGKALLRRLKDAAIDAASAAECFAQAKAGFDRQRERLEREEEAASAALEHAFDFMEQAFTDGQEMVVFLTGLTLTAEAAAFLAEHACSRYLQYNEQLLVGTKRAQLLSELKNNQ